MKATATIFDSLPGIEVPLGGIALTLDQIWAGEPDGGAAAPSEFRASQMNLVLHLGMRTTHETARRQFEVALALSRRHPARIVVLCPIQPDEPGSEMRAKIFSECYIGKSGREMICCEVVMLSYPYDTRRYMENQVSVCLETDLPTYYWPHCIASVARLEDYTYLLNGARRIIFDSECECAGIEEALSPMRGRLRDLAETRLLQVRQSLGRFVSSFAPSALVAGLKSVSILHAEGHAAEARRLSAWVQRSLDLCGGSPVRESVFSVRLRGESQPSDLSLSISYGEAGRFLRWDAFLDEGHARMAANLGSGEMVSEGPVSLLKPEVALAEALFS